jgi:hypothetical protein
VGPVADARHGIRLRVLLAIGRVASALPPSAGLAESYGGHFAQMDRKNIVLR